MAPRLILLWWGFDFMPLYCLLFRSCRRVVAATAFAYAMPFSLIFFFRDSSHTRLFIRHLRFDIDITPHMFFFFFFFLRDDTPCRYHAISLLRCWCLKSRAIATPPRRVSHGDTPALHWWCLMPCFMLLMLWWYLLMTARVISPECLNFVVASCHTLFHMLLSSYYYYSSPLYALIDACRCYCWLLMLFSPASAMICAYAMMRLYAYLLFADICLFRRAVLLLFRRAMLMLTLFTRLLTLERAPYAMPCSYMLIVWYALSHFSPDSYIGAMFAAMFVYSAVMPVWCGAYWCAFCYAILMSPMRRYYYATFMFECARYFERTAYFTYAVAAFRYCSWCCFYAIFMVYLCAYATLCFAAAFAALLYLMPYLFFHYLRAPLTRLLLLMPVAAVDIITPFFSHACCYHCCLLIATPRYHMPVIHYSPKRLFFAFWCYLSWCYAVSLFSRHIDIFVARHMLRCYYAMPADMLLPFFFRWLITLFSTLSFAACRCFHFLLHAFVCCRCLPSSYSPCHAATLATLLFSFILVTSSPCFRCYADIFFFSFHFRFRFAHTLFRSTIYVAAAVCRLLYATFHAWALPPLFSARWYSCCLAVAMLIMAPDVACLLLFFSRHDICCWYDAAQTLAVCLRHADERLLFYADMPYQFIISRPAAVTLPYFRYGCCLCYAMSPLLVVALTPCLLYACSFVYADALQLCLFCALCHALCLMFRRLYAIICWYYAIYWRVATILLPAADKMLLMLALLLPAYAAAHDTMMIPPFIRAYIMILLFYFLRAKDIARHAIAPQALLRRACRDMFDILLLRAQDGVRFTPRCRVVDMLLSPARHLYARHEARCLHHSFILCASLFRGASSVWWWYQALLDDAMARLILFMLFARCAEFHAPVCLTLLRACWCLPRDTRVYIICLCHDMPWFFVSLLMLLPCRRCAIIAFARLFPLFITPFAVAPDAILLIFSSSFTFMLMMRYFAFFRCSFYAFCCSFASPRCSVSMNFFFFSPWCYCLSMLSLFAISLRFIIIIAIACWYYYIRCWYFLLLCLLAVVDVATSCIFDIVDYLIFIRRHISLLLHCFAIVYSAIFFFHILPLISLLMPFFLFFFLLFFTIFFFFTRCFSPLTYFRLRAISPLIFRYASILRYAFFFRHACFFRPLLLPSFFPCFFYHAAFIFSAAVFRSFTIRLFASWYLMFFLPGAPLRCRRRARHALCSACALTLSLLCSYWYHIPACFSCWALILRHYAVQRTICYAMPLWYDAMRSFRCCCSSISMVVFFHAMLMAQHAVVVYFATRAAPPCCRHAYAMLCYRYRRAMSAMMSW